MEKLKTLREIQFLILFMCIRLFEKFKRFYAWLLFPIFKRKIYQAVDEMGLKLLKGQPQNLNELGIIKNEKEVMLRFVANPLYGILDSITDGSVTCLNFVDFMEKMIRERQYMTYINDYTDIFRWFYKHFNLQKGNMAWTVAKSHYDIGNDLYEQMLDPWMQYTCAYWRTASNLDQAQLDKMELIAQKLKLKPGMRVLELGCGFGGLAKYLAKYHGVEMVCCNISKEQVAYGRTMCRDLPVKFLLCDYRDVAETEKFDRVVAVGILEHVGLFNYRDFFQVVDRNLKDDGIALVHAMGVNDTSTPITTRWSSDNVFANSGFPKIEHFILPAEDLFMVEDLQNFGADYYHTLVEWEKNFEKAWPKLRGKYGNSFYRMWKTYLQSAQAMLRSRGVHLYQVVYSKRGILGGYYAPR